MWVGDLEADGLLYQATQIWCGVFKNLDTGEVREFSPISPENTMEDLVNFLDTVDHLCMHNGVSYDIPLMRKVLKYRYKGRMTDTLLMSRMQRPKRKPPEGVKSPHSVEAWGVRLGIAKPVHEDWSQFSPEMLHRCRTDVEIQQAIYEALIEEGKDEGWADAHALTTRMFTLLQMQEEYGWKVDTNHIDKCLRVLSTRMMRIDRVVTPHLPLVVEVNETKKGDEYNYVRKPFLKNGRPSQQVLQHYDDYYDDVGGCFSRVSFRRVDLEKPSELKTFLLNLGWEPAEWNMKDGKRTSPKLSKDDPFDGVQGSLGRLIAKRTQCKQRKAIIEGLKESVREDGRIPSVVTGLAATSRAMHTSIVNIPRAGSFFGWWMRRIFVADKGKVLVGTDSDACQIRMLVARMGDENYKEAVLHGEKDRGTDIHSVNQRAAGLLDRDTAKTFFYAFIFGAGDGKIGRISNGGAKQGKILKEQFLRSLPALQRLVDEVTGQWRGNAERYYDHKWGRISYRNGWITGLDGRRVYCETEHAVLCYVLQSDEAIMMQVAYSIFHKWMDQKGYVWGQDYGTVCWYHDEWTVECNPEIAEEVGQLAAKAIAWAGEYLKIDCPHIGNYQIGESWADIH